MTREGKHSAVAICGKAQEATPEVTGIYFQFPEGISVEEGLRRFCRNVRENFALSGIDPDDTDIVLLRITLPCGCAIDYRQEADIPREDTRCTCGANWFMRFGPRLRVFAEAT